MKADLEHFIEPYVRGDPESSLRWVGKSSRTLSRELNQQGHATSHSLVARLLQEMGIVFRHTKKPMKEPKNILTEMHNSAIFSRKAPRSNTKSSL
ncbi:MAG: hypothetical protein GY801_46240 [bacterium]|nr:hypothetical protein [bacterium]